MRRGAYPHSLPGAWVRDALVHCCEQDVDKWSIPKLVEVSKSEGGTRCWSGRTVRPGLRMDPVSAADSEPAVPLAGAIAADQIWKVAQEELRFQLSRPGYETWLANATLVGYDGH